jgi:hypothetical protein
MSIAFNRYASSSAVQQERDAWYDALVQASGVAPTGKQDTQRDRETERREREREREDRKVKERDTWCDALVQASGVAPTGDKDSQRQRDKETKRGNRDNEKRDRTNPSGYGRGKRFTSHHCALATGGVGKGGLPSSACLLEAQIHSLTGIIKKIVLETAALGNVSCLLCAMVSLLFLFLFLCLLSKQTVLLLNTPAYSLLRTTPAGWRGRRVQQDQQPADTH